MASHVQADVLRTTPLLSLLSPQDLARAARVCVAWRAPARDALGTVALLDARPFETWLEGDNVPWMRTVPAAVLNNRRNGASALVELMRDVVRDGLFAPIRGEQLAIRGGRPFYSGFMAVLDLLELPAVDVNATLDASESGSPIWDVEFWRDMKFRLFTTDGMAAVHFLPWIRETCHRGYEQKLREALERRGADFSARDADGHTEADLSVVAKERVKHLKLHELLGPKLKTESAIRRRLAVYARLEAFKVEDP